MTTISRAQLRHIVLGLLCGGLLLFVAACGKARSTSCFSSYDCQPGEFCSTTLWQCVRDLSGTQGDGGTNPPPPSPDGDQLPPTTTCQTGHECDAGASKCTVSGWIARCLTNPSTGCRSWTPGSPCPDGGQCSNNQCPSSSCTNTCTAGTQRCQNGALQSCISQNNGCTGWNGGALCPTGYTCKVDSCQPSDGTTTPPPTCQDECPQNGAQRCQGNAVQTCQLSGQCKKWVTTETCQNTQTCQANGSLAECKAKSTGGTGGKYEAELQFCVDEINKYRQKAGRQPVARDKALEEYGAKAAQDDAKTGQPHGYFSKTRGGGVSFAENEIPGWPISRYGSIKKIIEQGTLMMYNEGPGGGHHDNIVNSRYTKAGCGIYVTTDGKVWVVHEFR